MSKNIDKEEVAKTIEAVYSGSLTKKLKNNLVVLLVIRKINGRNYLLCKMKIRTYKLTSIV